MRADRLLRRIRLVEIGMLPDRSSILLVEDDRLLADAIREVLESQGYKVRQAEDGDLALEAAEAEQFDLVITDQQMATMSGLELLEQLKKTQPRLPVIVMTAFDSPDRAIEAAKIGAYEYLVKPFEMDEMLELARRAVATSHMGTEKLAMVPTADAGKQAIIGASRGMQLVFKEVGRVAAKPISVLIVGETGTGKELIARAIHQHSDRVRMPFVAVNCAAIPDNLIESELFGHERGAFTNAVSQRIGRFEMAHGGTLFLDEIGDLPWQTQVKLLRVLQERCISRVGGREEIPIDTRVISATHRDLELMISEGKFRQDLYYRLNAAVIPLPPLRDRREDVPLLARYFIVKYSAQFGFEPPALEDGVMGRLESYPWPGNVRQLENVVRKALLDARGNAITLDLIDSLLRAREGKTEPKEEGGLRELVRRRLLAASRGELEGRGAQDVLEEDMERELYQQAVTMSHGNQSSIAKWLGVSRLTVREKLDRFDLFPKRKKDGSK